MHASMAYVNGAGEERPSGSDRALIDKMTLMNTLLANGGIPTNDKQAEKDNQDPPISRPGGFENDPPDPKNPNEVRERHQRKVRP